MALMPKLPPRKEVGNDAFFSIPELEQLPKGRYTQVGNGKVLIETGFLEFCILRSKEQFFVAHTMRQINPADRFTLKDVDCVPFYGNARIKVVPMEKLPTGNYRVAGTGKKKSNQDINPSKIYILEKAEVRRDLQFIAIRESIANIPIGSHLEVYRRGGLMSISVDRKITGFEELLDGMRGHAGKSMYEWIEGRFMSVYREASKQ